MEEDKIIDATVESVFGRKAALCMISQFWKHKELALKHVCKAVQKQL